MEMRLEPGRSPDRLARATELTGAHGRDALAALAHEKIARPSCGRVAARSVSEVDVPDDADLLERLEVAVDRGEVRAWLASCVRPIASRGW